MNSVTLDTGVLPVDEDISQLCAMHGISLAISTVTDREMGDGDNRTVGLLREPETLVLDESRLDEARLASDEDDDRFEAILKIISSGSFPALGNREDLTKGQCHQLRDALAFEAHVSAGRDAFVTTDLKAFISGGRREKLEALCRTRILAVQEFRALLSKL